MKLAVFNSHQFENSFFEIINLHFKYDTTFFEMNLTESTVPLVQGFDVVCSYPNEGLKAPVVKKLKAAGVCLIALQSAAFDHVDLEAAEAHNLKVVETTFQHIQDCEKSRALDTDEKCPEQNRPVTPDQQDQLDKDQHYDIDGVTMVENEIVIPSNAIT